MRFKSTLVALSALMAASPAVSMAGEITVWADATRQPAVEAFQAAHPDVKVNLVVDDGSSGASGTFQTKIGLADQAGEGWPDVVFSTQNNDAAWTSKETNGVQAFAQVLCQRRSKNQPDGGAKVDQFSGSYLRVRSE